MTGPHVGLKRTRVVSGLDLGQAQKFIDWVVTERTSTLPSVHPQVWEHVAAVRHAERFPPGTDYADIFAAPRERYARTPLYRSPLAVERTGVGKPVVDLLNHSEVHAVKYPVTITAGTQAGRDGEGGWLVPKKDLVGLL